MHVIRPLVRFVKLQCTTLAKQKQLYLDAMQSAGRRTYDSQVMSPSQYKSGFDCCKNLNAKLALQH
jgi:hypothetical protein